MKRSGLLKSRIALKVVTLCLLVALIPSQYVVGVTNPWSAISRGNDALSPASLLPFLAEDATHRAINLKILARCLDCRDNEDIKTNASSIDVPTKAVAEWEAVRYAVFSDQQGKRAWYIVYMNKGVDAQEQETCLVYRYYDAEQGSPEDAFSGLLEGCFIGKAELMRRHLVGEWFVVPSSMIGSMESITARFPGSIVTSSSGETSLQWGREKKVKLVAQGNFRDIEGVSYDISMKAVGVLSNGAYLVAQRGCDANKATLGIWKHQPGKRDLKCIKRVKSITTWFDTLLPILPNGNICAVGRLDEIGEYTETDTSDPYILGLQKSLDIRIFDPDGQLIKYLEVGRYKEGVGKRIEFLRNGNIVTMGTDYKYRLWDQNGDLLKDLDLTHLRYMEGARNRVFCGGKEKVDIYGQNGDYLSTLEGLDGQARINLLAELPGGNIIVFDSDLKVRIYNTSGKWITTLQKAGQDITLQNKPHRFGVFSNGLVVIYCDQTSDGSMDMWTQEGDYVGTLEKEGCSVGLEGCNCLPNGKILTIDVVWCSGSLQFFWTGCPDDGGLVGRIWEPEGACVATLEREGRQVGRWGTWILPNARIITRDDDGTLSIWNQQGEYLGNFTEKEVIDVWVGEAFSQTIVITSHKDGSVSLWDVNGDLLDTVADAGKCHSILGNNQFCTVDQNGVTKFWEIKRRGSRSKQESGILRKIASHDQATLYWGNIDSQGHLVGKMTEQLSESISLKLKELGLNEDSIESRVQEVLRILERIYGAGMFVCKPEIQIVDNLDGGRSIAVGRAAQVVDGRVISIDIDVFRNKHLLLHEVEHELFEGLLGLLDCDQRLAHIVALYKNIYTFLNGVDGDDEKEFQERMLAVLEDHTNGLDPHGEYAGMLRTLVKRKCQLTLIDIIDAVVACAIVLPDQDFDRSSLLRDCEELNHRLSCFLTALDQLAASGDSQTQVTGLEGDAEEILSCAA